MTPATSLLRQFDTHRLIPSRYSDGGDSVLVRIADDDAHLADIFDLDNATNDRLLAEADRHAGIGTDELLFGLPYCRIVNAAYCHPNPLGGRFNGPVRGAWYAAFELATAQAEVAFHKAVELAECDWPEIEMTYDDYLADFSAEFHDLRDDPRFEPCLAPDSYVESQALASRLLSTGSLGVIYPSVRAKGICVACFRPALVMNVRKDRTHRFVVASTGRWRASPC
jgi:RES domain-containing protein